VLVRVPLRRVAEPICLVIEGECRSQRLAPRLRLSGVIENGAKRAQRFASSAC